MSTTFSVCLFLLLSANVPADTSQALAKCLQIESAICTAELRPASRHQTWHVLTGRVWLLFLFIFFF